MNSNSLRDLYRLNAVAAGAVITAADSIYTILAKWLGAEGGTANPNDTKNNLLKKLATIRAIQTFPGDSDDKILARIAGVGNDWNEWHLLRLIYGAAGPELGAFTLTVDTFVADLGFNTARASLEWTASTGAAGYRIQASELPDFSTLIVNANVGNVLSGSFTFSYDNTAPQENIYVRVVANNGFGGTLNSNTDQTHFNAWELETPAPVISDNGGGIISWVNGPGNIPVGYDFIELEKSASPTGPFEPAGSDASAGGITNIGADGVYVRARFLNLSAEYTPFSNIILAEP
jgi:hypothetical protein